MINFTGVKVLPFSTPLGAWDDLTYLEIFEFYDTPVLFSSLDSCGKIYLAVLIEDDKNRNITTWLYSEITFRNYILLREGDVDFRRSFSQDENTPYIMVRVSYGDHQNVFNLINKSDVDLDWLPEEGEYLDQEEIEELGKIPVIEQPLLTLASSNVEINGKNIENFPVFLDLKSNKYFKIYDAIKALKLSSLRKQSSTRSFSDQIPDAFLSLSFKGRGYSDKFPSIRLWEESSSIVTSSYRKAYYASRKESGHNKPISYPHALGLAASVTFELYPSDSQVLFGFDAKDNSESYTLSAISNVLSRVQAGNLQEEGSDPIFTDLMLQAIEELAPKENSNYEYVEVRINATADSPVRLFTISEETREIIKSARIALATDNEESKVVRIVGVIYEVKFDYEDKQAKVWVSVISILEGEFGSLNVVELHTTIDNVEEILKYVSEKPVEITAVYNSAQRQRNRPPRMNLISLEEYSPTGRRDVDFKVT